MGSKYLGWLNDYYKMQKASVSVGQTSSEDKFFWFHQIN